MSVHDLWQGNRTGPGKRWEVRYRSAGKQYKRRFASQHAAKAYDAKLKAGVEHVADKSRSLTVPQLMDMWYSTKGALRPKTLDAYRADMREVTDAFGDRLAASLKPSEVRVWASRKRGVSLRRRSLTALRQAYKLAQADQLLQGDPTVGVPLPKVAREEPKYLSWSELERLASAAGEHAPLVWVLGTCGLRLGEAVGLQGADVDRQRKRLRVRRSIVVTSSGLVEGPPKSGKPRDVPVPGFVLDMLPDVEGWLFTGAKGDRLDPHSWRERVFQPAARAAGLSGMHPHALRHTAASLAVAAGSDLSVVSRMLGHANMAITASVYQHLSDEHLDRVADRMQAAAEAHRNSGGEAA